MGLFCCLSGFQFLNHLTRPKDCKDRHHVSVMGVTPKCLACALLRTYLLTEWKKKTCGQLSFLYTLVILPVAAVEGAINKY